MNRSVCGDCMWAVIDTEGSCWESCEGRLRSGTKIKRKSTVYHTNTMIKAAKLLRLLQIGDIIVIDEDGIETTIRRK